MESLASSKQEISGYPVLSSRPGSSFYADAKSRGPRFLFYLLLVLALGTGIFLKVGPYAFAKTLSAFARLLEEKQEPMALSPPLPDPPAFYDALADIPQDLRALLTERTPAGEPVSFRFSLLVPPEDLCAAMAKAGLTNKGWTRAGENWQCMTDLLPVMRERPSPFEEKAGALPKSTLFFMARGPAEHRLSLIRFKLNLDDPKSEREGRARLIHQLEDVARILAWPVPEALREAISTHRKLALFERGIAVRVHPEEGAIERLNVVLRLEAPAFPLTASAFTRPAPW